VIARWERLGRRGLIVSVVFGPSGASAECRWTVDVMTRDFQSFDRPFAARSLEHAIEIAEIEAIERGWWLPESTT